MLRAPADRGATLSSTVGSIMIILAFIAFALIVYIASAIVLSAMFINALVLLGLHVFAGVFTARRARGIPLYWVIAVFGAIALCFVVLFAWHPIVVPEASIDESSSDTLLKLSGLGPVLAYWRLWTNSWPVLSGMAGAIICVGMSYSSRPLVRALTGLTWGAAAMTLFSWIYNPVV